MTKTRRKTSITKRLFLYIVAVVLGTSAIILMSNTLLLKPFYYSSIRSSMLGGIASLSEIDFTGDEDTWLDELDALTVDKAYDLIIANDEEVLYSSSKEAGLMPRPDGTGIGTGASGQSASRQDTEAEPQDQNTPQSPSQSGEDTQAGDRQPPFFRWHQEQDGWETVGDDTYMANVKEPRRNIEMLVCTKELDGGIRIALTQAIEPINQSVRQANILLLACALLSVAISIVFVFRMSRRFTRPIRQIQNTVGELAALNFGNRCDVRTGDELQNLGEDVNRLGAELESALNTLREQNIQLEKDIIAQRQFISNASHELRTPLALIKGYADEMNAGFATEAQQKDYYIEIIAEEAAKMNRLLKEMLELSRMESGRIELLYEALPINDRIRSFLEKYDGFISENNLHISLELDGDPVGHIDAMRFEQVLANYISNAARYGDEKKIVRISTKAHKDTVRVSVFNSGQPISDDHLSSIWDGFFKADEARTRVKDSYGLGLSVVKAIQNVSGQQCGVKNVSGGVVFWFDVRRLPDGKSV